MGDAGLKFVEDALLSLDKLLSPVLNSSRCTSEQNTREEAEQTYNNSVCLKASSLAQFWHLS